MGVNVINWLIKNRLKPGHNEDETARVWNEILHLEYNEQVAKLLLDKGADVNAQSGE